MTTKIGRYEILGLVGEGAMAKVYRARDPEIDRIVAIKVLKDELAADEEYASRFVQEAKAAGAISHPNIVTIYDVGRDGRASYIAMEFIDENSLAEVFTEGMALPVKRVLSMGIQLARALDHAHKRGVVHRDIKLGNVLVMEKGQTVKITDFGIARLDRGEDLQKTHAGTVVGTPRYMSPEQASGKNMDGRSDLFSLGVILYELVTGRRAFDSKSMATLMLQIVAEEPTPIGKLAPDVPAGMQRIISKLLQKRPDRRFQTGAQLAEALEREMSALVEREEEATRDKFMPLKIKWALASGAVLAVVFAISLSVVYSIEARVIRDQVLDEGAALANFVATQAAVPVLGKNWVPLELFVKDASERASFDYLVVTDHENVVKAATDETLIDNVFVPLPDAETITDTPALRTSSANLPNGTEIFLFDTPILFQNTEIGRIRLGLNRAGMDDVLRSTLLLMSALGVLSVAAVFGMVYLIGGLLTRPLRSLHASLLGLATGDLDRRVTEERKDEIGQLFKAFNQMADSVQTRAQGSPERNAVFTPPVVLPQASGHDLDATMLLTSTSAPTHKS